MSKPAIAILVSALGLVACQTAPTQSANAEYLAGSWACTSSEYDEAEDFEATYDVTFNFQANNFSSNLKATSNFISEPEAVAHVNFEDSGTWAFTADNEVTFKSAKENYIITAGSDSEESQFFAAVSAEIFPMLAESVDYTSVYDIKRIDANNAIFEDVTVYPAEITEMLGELDDIPFECTRS